MKTGAEIVHEWFKKYSEQNGTPTPSEILAQLEMAIEHDNQVLSQQPPVAVACPSDEEIEIISKEIIRFSRKVLLKANFDHSENDSVFLCTEKIKGLNKKRIDIYMNDFLRYVQGHYKPCDYYNDGRIFFRCKQQNLVYQLSELIAKYYEYLKQQQNK